MARFFINSNTINNGEASVTGNDAYHIARSLRMAVGDKLTLCDESGNEYSCELTRIRDEECTLKILGTAFGRTESPFEITLYMAYPKGDKLETVVQKSVELGAAAVIPFESSRCIKRPSDDRQAKITERLSRIAEEAAKQCGRSRLPRVSQMLKLREVLDSIKRHDITLFCYENEKTLTLKAALEKFGRKQGSIGVIIGAEGGFSPEEAERIAEAGAVCVSLGPRILRCETAPEYCLSAISYFAEL